MLHLTASSDFLYCFLCFFKLIHHCSVLADINCSNAAPNIRSPARSASDAEGEFYSEELPYDPRISITVNVRDESFRGVGSWFFSVETSSYHMDMPVGRFCAYLAKRECIKPAPGEKRQLNFRGALKKTCPDLCTIFKEPLKFFLKSGALHPEFEAFANSFFVYDDFKHYRESTGSDTRGKCHKMQPGYRAWILFIDDILVDKRYRRRGIGEMMVRESLTKVASEAEQEDRPLLVIVQPQLLDDIPITDLISRDGHHRIHLKSEVAEVF